MKMHAAGVSQSDYLTRTPSKIRQKNFMHLLSSQNMEKQILYRLLEEALSRELHMLL